MKRLFQKILRPKRQIITIVSGLPRSGTSMMMKMLDAGGIPPLTDHFRTADDDNPKGYYEFERAKKLKDGDVAWVVDAQGKSVKVISALLTHLPNDYSYRVLFMRRKMEEILASQKKMLDNRGEESDISDEKMAVLYQKHLNQVETWMKNQHNLTYIDVDFNQVLKKPQLQISLINQFLGSQLNIEEMVAAVDPELYRQRK